MVDCVWIVQEQTHWRTKGAPSILGITRSMEDGIAIVTKKLDTYDAGDRYKFTDRGTWKRSKDYAACDGYNDDVSFHWTVTKYAVKP